MILDGVQIEEVADVDVLLAEWISFLVITVRAAVRIVDLKGKSLATRNHKDRQAFTVVLCTTKLMPLIPLKSVSS